MDDAVFVSVGERASDLDADPKTTLFIQTAVSLHEAGDGRAVHELACALVAQGMRPPRFFPSIRPINLLRRSACMTGGACPED